jgi:predicted RNA binding protein YcfA (HicA-like mRNA interferase family)
MGAANGGHIFMGTLMAGQRWWHPREEIGRGLLREIIRDEKMRVGGFIHMV